MNTLEAIANRRSIRRFKPDPIPADALLKILAAGTQAPSGGQQPALAVHRRAGGKAHRDGAHPA